MTLFTVFLVAIPQGWRRKTCGFRVVHHPVHRLVHRVFTIFALCFLLCTACSPFARVRICEVESGFRGRTAHENAYIRIHGEHGER
jgi:hypothetical protein